MNASVPICKFCHGTANALTTLVADGHDGLTIRDPKKLTGRFVACQACSGTGLMPQLNLQIVDLLTELAECPLEFLDEVDEDGLPIENPEFGEEEEIEHREFLIRAARRLLERLRVPLRLSA